LRPGVQVLQQEPGRTVALEDGGLIVRKTFHGADRAQLAQMAAREIDRMARFREALDGIDSATCPRPVELGGGPEPFLRMERARGVPMQDHLASEPWDRARYDRVGHVLREALTRYVETFGEPYWDFILRNMFYDPGRDLVTFLDFGVPTIYLPALDRLARHAPMEVSLGGLVASAVFESARPRRMRRRLEHRQAATLAAVVLERCLAASDGLPLSRAGVHTVAFTTYGLAAAGGGWGRRQWYRWYGATLGRQSDKLERLCRQP
jgi:hypothetical protein